MASSATAVPSLSVMSSDSPVSSSPDRSNFINVKRAAVTYSRKRHAIEEEGLSSVPAARDSWDEVHTRTLLSVNDEPLSSSNSSRLSDETSANEDIGRDEAPGFVFAWKKKLAEWSDQEEPGSSTPNANKQLSANLSRPRPIDTPETRSAATTYSLGSDISPEQLFAIDDGHGGISVTEVMSSPPPSAGMGPSRRRAFHRDVVRDSGSESELSNAKLESSFHKSSPFAFQTPNSRSSPTPPTSDDETSPWPTLPKGKGKMGTISRGSVSPLRLGGEPLSAMGSGNLEGTSGNRRTKVRKVKVRKLQLPLVHGA
jgi:mediator of replication checkpoint protein 1